ncbi:Crp/Fnr family transcriptional regulator [Bacillus sp. FJAT-49732]|uniref:Crp/Fnr family transcriptional regulator n=2 Tax=Lederbergia citrisecunda TaxID=2833583 RepID=A0A942TPR7_9BACI|nr:Crp/Fnr family transcriptional regulator [Lederbergia citrisecunda]MBS4202230.1 Crp/Fnr family transcriptional regulator [Lederbergia citrisecunda]
MNGKVESANLEGLLAIVHHDIELKKDAYLFQEGDLADGIYYIRSGKIRIGKVSPDGREIAFQIFSEGDFIYEISLYADSSPYTVHARAIEDSVCAKIKKDVLEENLLLKPSLNVEFMKMMSLHHKKMQSKFRDLILHGKKGALYSTLIRLTNSYGVEQEGGILIDLSLTNQELANFCGMSREVVNRMLSTLKKDSKLSMQDGKILVHDLEYLREENHCEICPIEICKID